MPKMRCNPSLLYGKLLKPSLCTVCLQNDLFRPITLLQWLVAPKLSPASTTPFVLFCRALLQCSLRPVKVIVQLAILLLTCIPSLYTWTFVAACVFSRIESRCSCAQAVLL